MIRFNQMKKVNFTVTVNLVNFMEREEHHELWKHAESDFDGQ